MTPTLELNWIALSLAGVAALEALILSFLKPRSSRMRECATSLFVHLGRTAFSAPLLSFFVRIVFPFAVFGNLLIALGPHRFFLVPEGEWWALPVIFVLADFLHYWDHRFKHSVYWFWPNHAVHHSSEHYDLAAGLRLGWTGSISTNLVFFAPLVLLGFDPKTVLQTLAAQQLYQLSVHLEWVPKLGVLERFLVTPSHHRVHHATNPQYINRNFGGVFIVFDRVFGTFAEENSADPCRYGLVHPLENQNPIRVLFEPWRRLVLDVSQNVAHHRNVKSVFKLVFGPIPSPHEVNSQLEHKTDTCSPEAQRVGS